jgi:hypothetical protein
MPEPHSSNLKFFLKLVECTLSFNVFKPTGNLKWSKIYTSSNTTILCFINLNSGDYFRPVQAIIRPKHDDDLHWPKLLLQWALQPWLGFGMLNCRWAFSAGRFYRVPLPAARQTPTLEENQWCRAFQLSPQEVPSVWSDVNEPSSGRWNYGGEMTKNFAESGDFHVTFVFFYMP